MNKLKELIKDNTGSFGGYIFLLHLFLMFSMLAALPLIMVFGIYVVCVGYR